MYSIKIKGLASGKVIKNINIEEPIQEISLMDFLLAYGIPIASSCQGQGVCSKCTINNNLLSCQISLKNFLKLSPCQEISISYL